MLDSFPIFHCSLNTIRPAASRRLRHVFWKRLYSQIYCPFGFSRMALNSHSAPLTGVSPKTLHGIVIMAEAPSVPGAGAVMVPVLPDMPLY